MGKTTKTVLVISGIGIAIFIGYAIYGGMKKGVTAEIPLQTSTNPSIVTANTK